MQQSIDVIRQLIERVWRRRYLLVLPVVFMLPLSVLLGLLGPKTYTAKSLMLLQESMTTNPLGKDFAVNQSSRMQERIAGLQALMKSDRVLTNVYRDLYGEPAPGEAPLVAAWMREFGSDLTLELIGTDFIEFRLKRGKAAGMGKQLEAVTARFIEALLPEQNAQFATQVLLDKRKDDLDAAERALAAFRQRNSEVLPDAASSPNGRLADTRAQLERATTALEAIKAELSQVQGRLAVVAKEGPARIEQLISQASAEIRSLEGRGGDAGAELHAVQQRLQDLMNVRTLETRRGAAEDEIREIRLVADGLQREVRRTGPVLQQLAQLEREAQEARAAFDAYSVRYSRSSVGRAGGILNAPERIKLIDVPRDPEFATTGGMRLALGSLALGVLAGIGLAMLAELFDSCIRRPEDLVQASQLPIVARLA